MVPRTMTTTAAVSATLLAASVTGALAGPRGTGRLGPVAASGGTIVLKVADYDPARERVLQAASGQQAELLGSHTEINFQGKKSGWLRFRLAADHLPPLLGTIHQAGKLYAENVHTGDYTSEYEELGRRVSRLREHQQRLAELLRTPRHMRGSDILYLQDRLFRAGVDEETLTQRRIDLERAAHTINLMVQLFEPEPRRAMDLGDWYAGAVLRARTALYRDIAHGLTAGAYLLIFAPLWIPALVACVWLGRWLWRRTRGVAARIAGTAWLLAGELLARWRARSSPPAQC